MSHPLTQLAVLSLLIAVILGIVWRLHRMFSFKTDNLGWFILAALMGGSMLLLGIWMGKLIGALTGGIIVILIWVIGESIHAGRERKKNESQ